jgi:hypothetical protein
MHEKTKNRGVVMSKMLSAAFAGITLLLAACSQTEEPVAGYAQNMPHHQMQAAPLDAVAQPVYPDAYYTPQQQFTYQQQAAAPAPAPVAQPVAVTPPAVLQGLPAYVPFEIKPSPFKAANAAAPAPAAQPVAAPVQPELFSQQPVMQPAVPASAYPVAQPQPVAPPAGYYQQQPVPQQPAYYQQQPQPADMYGSAPPLLPLPPQP